MNDDDVWGARLSGVLQREADRVAGTPDAPPQQWDGVLLPVGAGAPQGPLEPRRRRPTWLPAAAAAAAVVAVAGGLTAVVLDRGSDRPTPPATATRPSVATATSAAPATNAPATPSTSASPVRTGAVALYWVGGDAGRRGLYREFRQAPTGPAGAVSAMLSGRATDPDLASAWRPARVGGGAVSGPAGDRTVSLDLSSAAFAATGLDAEQVRLALQQLAYTATAAVKGSTTLRLTVDGKPGYRAWGRLTVPATIRRDAQARASIWITSPQQDDTLSRGTVHVKGSGWAFEGTILWEVSLVPATGRPTVLKRGFTTTRGDGVPGDFDIALTLPNAGRYRFVAYEADMSYSGTGEGPRLNLDSKEFTVR